MSVAIVAKVVEENLPGRGYGLSIDQALAVEKIATSGRVLDVLVGPAGTGKSTAMAGLRTAWEQAHGPGSVIGLAPSAAAAEVLGDELGIETENTAKWLFEWRRVPELTARRDRLALNLARHAYPSSADAAKLRAQLGTTDRAIAERRLKRGQLVMIDEATLAGTFALDELVSAARQAGSKVLLLGDGAQIGSIEAGGAFSLLVRDRGDLVPELTRRPTLPVGVGEGCKRRASARRRVRYRRLPSPRSHHRRRARSRARRSLRSVEGRRGRRQVEPDDRR